MRKVYKVYRTDWPESSTRFGYYTTKETAAAALKFIVDEILKKHPSVKVGTDEDSPRIVDFFTDRVTLVAPTRTETIGVVEYEADQPHESLLPNIEDDDWRFQE
jgi:hypothetical protein